MRRISITALIALVIIFCSYSLSFASQADDIFTFISWQSDSAIPEDYPGKALPNKSSTVTALLNIVEGGVSLEDLSRWNIRWFINGRQIASQADARSISIPVGDYSLESLRIEARAQLTGSTILKSAFADIPVVTPRVVIDAPYPRDTFSGGPIMVRSRVFFAPTLSRFQMGWQINGVGLDRGAQPSVLNFSPDNAPSGAGINIAVRASDRLSLFTTISDTLTLYMR